MPEKTSGKGYLQLKLSGEQSDIAVNILLANDRNTGENLKTSQNIIFLRDIQAKTQNDSGVQCGIFGMQFDGGKSVWI